MMRKTLLIVFLFICTFCVMAALQKPVNAVTGSDWRAGRIIDDGIMRSSRTMSVQDIQYFLNSKLPACDTWGAKTSEFAGGIDYNGDGRITRAEYGRYRGNPAPYICLRDYYENVDTKANNLGGTVPAGAKSAAQIIYDYAQYYGINPQVLITLLQKEQTLVGDEWPWPIQYKSATGYGCPDTAPCDSQYYGFSNQVRWAARMYQAIVDNDPNWYSPYIKGNNYIQWNPNSGCGGTNVNVENWSTASLYSYTPYQPNQAALNNLYGLGDGCSAYGNRNFWRLFNDWFGTTTASAYAWQPVQQLSFTDQTMSTPTGTLNLLPGQRIYLVIKAKNIGSTTWKRGVARSQINLGTSFPIDRKSSFCDTTWMINTDCNRIVTTTEAEVAPGEIGTFGFWIKAPQNTGTYNEYFNLVADGVTWLNDPGLYWTLRVLPPTYSWQPIEQSHYLDSSKATRINTLNLAPNQRYYLVIKAKNTGNMTWRKGVAGQQVNVGTSYQHDRKSVFCDSTWMVNCNRVVTTLENSVAPGQVGTFEFWIKTPVTTGTYNEFFNLVADGTTWLNDPGLYWTLRVKAPNFTWQPVQQSSYTDQTKATPVHTLNLAKSQRYYLVIKAKNTGNVTWEKGVAGKQINLGTTYPMDRRSVFCDSTWMVNCNRVVTTVEGTVAPGQVGTFEFWIATPNTSGTYNEFFNLVADGVTWLNDPGLYWTLRTN